MNADDILTVQAVKMFEYGIALLFLLLFVPFWRFVHRRDNRAPLAEIEKTPGSSEGWFSVPEDCFFHRGHAWVRPESADLVTVGLDEFAARLVGRAERLLLPPVGTKVGQGEPGWRLACEDGTEVEMLSPVDGTIALVNPDARSEPSVSLEDPYGKGWLMKISPARLRANCNNLLCGSVARRWMEDAASAIGDHLALDLGALVQDGGAPVAGLARSTDSDEWAAMVRKHLLTEAHVAPATTGCTRDAAGEKVDGLLTSPGAEHPREPA